MSKIMNAPEKYVEEALGGFCLAHPQLHILGEERRVIARSHQADSGKVGIVSGGGFGHLPLFCGYVGPGLLDACSVGNVFEGPTVGSCVEAIKAANFGSGILCLFGNYGGDRMNFEMAADLLELEGIATRTVLGNDDIASATPAEAKNRRGVAGLIFAYKCAGAAADKGMDLSEVARVAQLVVDQTRTIGFATAPCKIPGAVKSSFEIPTGEMDFGIGIHGEPGIWRAKIRTANEIVSEMMEQLLAEKPADSGSDVAVLVNSLGATSYEELFIMYNKVADILKQAQLEPLFRFVGPYVTSMEMAGASVSLCFLNRELAELMGQSADCPFWKV